MRVLVLAARDPSNPHRAGGDITMWEVARHLAARGDQVEYVCASFPGAALEEELEGVRIRRLGGLFTAAPRAFLRYVRRGHPRPDVVVEEALGGLRIPYVASAYVGVPTVAFWYQTHRRIFAHQFGPRIASGLHRLARVLAGDRLSKDEALDVLRCPDEELLDLLAADAAVTRHLERESLARLCDPARYLGQAGALVDRVPAPRARRATMWAPASTSFRSQVSSSKGLKARSRKSRKRALRCSRIWLYWESERPYLESICESVVSR